MNLTYWDLIDAVDKFGLNKDLQPQADIEIRGYWNEKREWVTDWTPLNGTERIKVTDDYISRIVETFRIPNSIVGVTT